MTGDLHELTILNHYIGMPPIEAPAFETAMFPVGIALLVGLCLIAPLHKWPRRLAVTATAAMPLVILADLQWRLYLFGHSLNPTAPIRLKPFTPLVIGETHMGNFESHGMVSWGFWCFVVAALLLYLGARIGRRAAARRRAPGGRQTTAVAAMVTALIVLPAAPGDGPGRVSPPGPDRRGPARQHARHRERTAPGPDRDPRTPVRDRRARARSSTAPAAAASSRSRVTASCSAGSPCATAAGR